LFAYDMILSTIWQPHLEFAGIGSLVLPYNVQFDDKIHKEELLSQEDN